jgi:hypothetical protein
MAKFTSVEDLQLLIEELTKERPNQVRVKKLMQANGIPYSPDSIQQMSTVLTLMSHLSPGIQKPTPNRLKEKESEI